MFAPAMGVREDPATGSAAAAFVGVLGLHVGGAHALTIEQGYEMGRPSSIQLAMTMQSESSCRPRSPATPVIATEGTIECMSEITIVPVERLGSLSRRGRGRSRGAARRDRRAFRWAAARQPRAVNGRVLMLHEYAFAGAVFRGAYLETDYELAGWRH